MTIIPYSQTFDQSTMGKLIEHDAVVQRSRRFFALFDWSVVPQPVSDPSRPGKRAHPQSAYIKALLIKLAEGYDSCTKLRAYLLEHPLLVLDLGFRPVLDLRQPYGFDVGRTLPTARWLRHQQRSLPQAILQALLAATVRDLCEAVPGLGETVAVDVTHIYAWVKENNLRVYVPDRYHKDVQPRGDPDCRLGVKKGSNRDQHAGPSSSAEAVPKAPVKPKRGRAAKSVKLDEKKDGKESLWGYGSGVVSATIAGYGDVVLAEWTQPFNENDHTYFPTLSVRTLGALGFFPTHLTADAAYDAWYVYQMVALRGGIAAVPLNEHGHGEGHFDPDGTPLCDQGLRMHPTYQFQHTNGYRAQRFRCPLLFPQRTGQHCPHEQFAKGKGCVKDPNWHAGGRMRVLLDRDGPLYHAIYCQRTSTERINSQSEALGIKRPKVRTIRSVRTLNTLTYLLINARALQRVREVNASLLTTAVHRVL